MGKLGFLFPGQGSASVGMGVEIARFSPAAAKVFDALREVRPDVHALCLEGPKEELIRTANAQPAIFGVDCACLASLEERGIRPDLVAGHSLGEYAALVAAGVVDFATGLELVIERGRLMEQATSARAGTMMAVLRLAPERVAELVEAWQGRGVIANANDNAPGQVVISGDATTLEVAAADFKEAGGRVMPLPVGGAFHSPLMREAQDAFLPILDAAAFADARVPVVSNVSAILSQDGATLKASLRAQITGSVRWRESMEAMLEAGVDTFVEVGPGKVLAGLAQRCAQGHDVKVLNVEDAASLEKTLADLGVG